MRKDFCHTWSRVLTSRDVPKDDRRNSTGDAEDSPGTEVHKHVSGGSHLPRDIDGPGQGSFRPVANQTVRSRLREDQPDFDGGRDEAKRNDDFPDLAWNITR